LLGAKDIAERRDEPQKRRPSKARK
jgi:hypothetical protein